MNLGRIEGALLLLLAYTRQLEFISVYSMVQLMLSLNSILEVDCMHVLWLVEVLMRGSADAWWYLLFRQSMGGCAPILPIRFRHPCVFELGIS